jgi:hypothetical protein
MNERRSFSFSNLRYPPLLVLVLFFVLTTHIMNTCIIHPSISREAHGHLAELPGAQSDIMSKSIGNYVILFQTSPSPAQVNNNMTMLRFSIMQNNQDTYGVFAALAIKEKSSGNISMVFPYKFYEFGDIDFRHTFQNAVDHEVMLQARISGDSYYQNNPLVASFDVPVITAGEGGPLGNFVQIIVILVLIALPVGIIILILDFNKRVKRESSSTSK